MSLGRYRVVIDGDIGGRDNKRLEIWMMACEGDSALKVIDESVPQKGSKNRHKGPCG